MYKTKPGLALGMIDEDINRGFEIKCTCGPGMDMGWSGRTSQKKNIGNVGFDILTKGKN